MTFASFRCYHIYNNDILYCEGQWPTTIKVCELLLFNSFGALSGSEVDLYFKVNCV